MNQKVKKYAGLLSRFLALMIDFFIFCAIFFPITRIVKGVWVMSVSNHHWGRGLFITDPLCIAFLAFMFLYFIFTAKYPSSLNLLELQSISRLAYRA